MIIVFLKAFLRHLVASYAFGNAVAQRNEQLYAFDGVRVAHRSRPYRARSAPGPGDKRNSRRISNRQIDPKPLQACRLDPRA